MSREAKTGRVHMRLPSELKAWAMEYAAERHTTLSTLVIQLLTDLQERSKPEVDAEQV